jgi:hypothetical protein
MPFYSNMEEMTDDLWLRADNVQPPQGTEIKNLYKKAYTLRSHKSFFARRQAWHVYLYVYPAIRAFLKNLNSK